MLLSMGLPLVCGFLISVSGRAHLAEKHRVSNSQNYLVSSAAEVRRRGSKSVNGPAKLFLYVDICQDKSCYMT